MDKEKAVKAMKESRLATISRRWCILDEIVRNRDTRPNSRVLTCHEYLYRMKPLYTVVQAAYSYTEPD